MIGTGVRWLSLLAGLAVAVQPRVARAQSSEDREVVEILFEGNAAFSAGDLSSAILTEQTHCRTFLFKFPLPLCPLTNWGFAHVREYLDEDELPLDLLRLRLYYRQRGYREAQVDTLMQREDRRVRILFTVDEAEPTRIASLDIEGGEDLLDTARVRRELPVQVGDPLDLLAMGRGERAIAERLRRDGYVHAAVLREYFIPSDTHEAAVILKVEPGPQVRVGEITVQGSGEVGDEVVRELLSFKSGQWFEEDRILDSQRSLYNLEALRWANISTVRRPDTDTVIDLQVQVAPAPKRSLRAGLGVYTDDCVQVQSEFLNRNFLGNARILRLSGRLSNLFARSLEGSFPCSDVSETAVYQELNYLLQVGFEQPVFSRGRNTLRASLFTERETVPDLYVRTGTGGELALSRRLRSRMLLTLAYRPELTSFAEESADIYFCVNFGFCTPEDIGVLSDARWLSPLAALWSYDRTDNPFSATRGYRLAVELERAGAVTLSDYKYFRATLDAAAFGGIGASGVLGLRLRIGGIAPTAGTVFSTSEVDDVVHPKKRFFAGGPESVRGFGLNLLGPTVLVVEAENDCAGLGLEECVSTLAPPAFDERPEGGNVVIEGSLEARFPLGNRWTMVGFVDFGQVWEEFDRREPLVLTPGVGFRFRSPVGPFRVDIGYNPTGSAVKDVVAVLSDGSIEELQTRVDFDPFAYDDPSLITEAFRRMQLQLSIGEAF